MSDYDTVMQVKMLCIYIEYYILPSGLEMLSFRLGDTRYAFECREVNTNPFLEHLRQLHNSLYVPPEAPSTIE